MPTKYYTNSQILDFFLRDMLLVGSIMAGFSTDQELGYHELLGIEARSVWVTTLMACGFAASTLGIYSCVMSFCKALSAAAELPQEDQPAAPRRQDSTGLMSGREKDTDSSCKKVARGFAQELPIAGLFVKPLALGSTTALIKELLSITVGIMAGALTTRYVAGSVKLDTEQQAFGMLFSLLFIGVLRAMFNGAKVAHEACVKSPALGM